PARGLRGIALQETHEEPRAAHEPSRRDGLRPGRDDAARPRARPARDAHPVGRRRSHLPARDRPRSLPRSPERATRDPAALRARGADGAARFVRAAGGGVSEEGALTPAGPVSSRAMHGLLMPLLA